MKNEYRAGDELDVEIKKIVPQGLGLAFAEKLTVFVALAAAGDVARVRLSRVKGRTAFAEIVQILQPGNDRTTPPCKYFGRCGGCDMQQMTYSAQVAAKSDIITDALTRLGRIELNAPVEVVASPRPLGYRLRAQWQVDSRRRMIGYFRRHSHEVIDIDHCPILLPQLGDELQRLRQTDAASTFWEPSGKITAAAGDAAVSIYSPELIEPIETVSRKAAGETYFYSARGFFQGNAFLLDELVAAATDLPAGELVYDLYCGVGLFSLPLARRFGRVAGVEANAEAIEFAKQNAEHARLPNIRFEAAGVGKFLAASAAVPDAVVLDPPRTGTEPGVIEALISAGPRVISYVSCDPAILARDLRKFVDAGYSIEMIRGFDLFPQTHHVETVVRLGR